MSKCVRIHIDELVIGREVNFPIHGTSGILLLGAGTAITSDLKQRLKSRNVSWVVLNEADARVVTLRDSTHSDASEDTLNERLESILRLSVGRAQTE